ncbi:MAG: hypothetical protein LC746_05700, partial [Acidobacteria bacterium]|nr:hypothetical protein [Acidobacteriota bacterium]
IKVTLVSSDATISDNTISSEPIPNPAYLKIGNVGVVSYEPAKGKTPATLVVRIEGSGFSDDLRASLGVLVVKSATEAILKIDNPRPAEVVELTDTKTGATVKTIVVRKPPAQDEQQ